MKVDKILVLDCRIKENREKVNEALLHIKPFAKYANKNKIPMEAIENFVEKLCRKYNVKIQYVMFSYLDEECRWYTMSFMSDDGEGNWHGMVNGYTMWELFAKASLYLFKKIKDGVVEKRKE